MNQAVLAVGDRMDFKIPFDEKTLRESFDEIACKLDDVDINNKVSYELSKVLGQSTDNLIKNAAEFHGMSLKDFHKNSKNEELKEEYARSIMAKVVTVLNGVGFSDKQSWSLLAASLGILKI